MKKTFLLPLLLFATAISAQGSELITVETSSTAMVLKVEDDNSLKLVNYGAKMADYSPFLYHTTNQLKEQSTDRLAYPTRGGREVNEAALAVTHNGGAINCQLKYKSHQTTKIDNNTTLTSITLVDDVAKLEVELNYKAFKDEDVIRCNSIITNKGKKELLLEKFYSSSLPIFAQEYDLYHFSGIWAAEMGMNHTKLTSGIKTIESKKLVRTTQSENGSFVLTLDGELNENSGKAIIGALEWSGNFQLKFEINEYKSLNILAGINPYTSQRELDSKESFTTPGMLYTYSNSGVGQASRNMHDWARSYGIWKGDRVRPTLLNSWEGAYFKFNTSTITSMIDDAASMGLEMFVLDDGWFGNNYPRNNDSAGLGDWQVNTKKLPEGIDYLADYAVEKGIKFGIWIEPEMVNPNSDLAHNHPEWILADQDREVTTMRKQLLLDLSNSEVQDFVFSVFDNVLAQSSNISYIKWDANRHCESPYSSHLDKDKQKELYIDYINGLYSVYDRIRAKYPDVYIQVCSSGGGRIDYGSLKYHDEAWASDNTDAMCRAFIQYGTNMIYPSIITGSHVSTAPNHQSGNITPLKFRFDMAMTGRLGMELQPKSMSEAERNQAKKYIETYKSVRDIVNWGDLYRINSPYDKSGYYSLAYVSKDKRRALLFTFGLEYHARFLSPALPIAGVDSNLNYKVTELNVARSQFWANGKVISGEFIKNVGLNPTISRTFASGVYLLEATE